MDFKEIFAQFNIDGKLIDYKAKKEGHINSTYISTVANANGEIDKYTHQMINTYVFNNPYNLMNNIEKVTSHIQSKIKDLDNKGKRCLQIIKTREDELLFKDINNNFWRTYKFIDNVKTFDKVNNANQAYILAKAVGQFQKQLEDFNDECLFETIKDFHNIAFRYKQLEEAINNDKVKRLSSVIDEVQFLLDNKNRAMIIWDLYEKGELKKRVTHNDAKINNVLFSEDEKEALCIIDLDTVMRGTILFDVGDMIRSTTSTAVEDEVDFNKMKCNVEYFEALVKGYLEVTSSFISEKEKSLIAEAGRYITLIMAIRFLTDYLNGDVYFTTEREHHNLDRCRTQIALIKDMDLKWEHLTNCLK